MLMHHTDRDRSWLLMIYLYVFLETGNPSGIGNGYDFIETLFQPCLLTKTNSTHRYLRSKVYSEACSHRMYEDHRPYFVENFPTP